MAKLRQKPNKRQEARQTADDLLKDHDYVYSPGDNTYQLVNKDSGETYTGPLGGLDADKGLIQKNRRMNRLIGEQLSHKRQLSPKSSAVPKKEVTVNAPAATSASTTTKANKPATLTPRLTEQEAIDAGYVTQENINKIGKTNDELITPAEMFEFNSKFAKSLDPNAFKLELSKKPLISNNLLDNMNLLAPRPSVPSATKLQPVEQAKTPEADPNTQILAKLGLSEDIYYPGDDFYGMNAKNTVYFEEPGGRDLSRYKGKYRYAVVGQGDKQRYVDIEGDPSSYKELPEGFRLAKGVSVAAPFVPTYPGKERVTENYWSIPEFTDKYQKRIDRALTSGDRYMISGNKMYDMNTMPKSASDLNSLSQYGVDIPKGVGVNTAGGSRKSFHYYKKNGGVLKAQSGMKIISPDYYGSSMPLETAGVTSGQALVPKSKPAIQWTAGTEMVPTKKKLKGRDKVASTSSGTFDADTRSVMEKSLDYANPVLGAADFLMQRKAINDLEKSRKSLEPVYETAAQVNVQAAQDIPPEVLAQKENDILRMRSDYKGSDPVMELVSKQLVEDQRQGARERLSSERAAFVADERRRVSQEKGQNQLRAAETDQKNRELRRNYLQFDLQAETAKIAQKAALSGRAISTVAKGIENRLTTKDMSHLKANEMSAKNIEQDIETKKFELSNLSEAESYKAVELRKEIAELSNQLSQKFSDVEGYYNKFGKRATLSMKTGGKLLPRK